MAASSSSSAVMTFAGEEVPIPGSDNINWISLTAPSSSPPHLTSSSTPSDISAPLDVSGCHVINDEPQTYIIWRIHKNLPNAVEIFDISPSNQLPSSGLRLVFKEPLYPFSFIYRNEVENGSASLYSLYAVTISGCAYLCNIHSPSSYSPGSILHENEILEINVQNNSQNGEINAVTATPGCLVIGRLDGSITCYQLGKLNPNSQGFSYELRDDAVIGLYIWNLVSRARIVGAVQDFMISEIFERKLLFSIHKDGVLRVWDLFNRTRLLCFNFSISESQGVNPSRLWVGLVDTEKEMIRIAILHRGVSEQEQDRVSVYSFDINADEKSFFSPEPSRFDVPVGEGNVVDVKINTSKLWILKQIGSIQYELIEFDCGTENTIFYKLQEETISEQLFQNSDNILDDLLWTNDTLISSLKDEAMNFISNIFLRRLLQPEVYQSSALRETFLDYNKFLSESQFQSLSLTGIRKEILGVIQHEGGTKNPNSIANHWKGFCSRFLNHRFENSLPFGLFFDLENNSFGLIRKKSISLIRLRDSSEILIQDASIDSQLLDEIHNCINQLTNHIGHASSAIYQESLISSVISTEEIICLLVKVLEAGFSFSSSTSSLINRLGSDAYLAKQQLSHRKQRKFSVDILLSLNALRSKATNWENVFKIIEKYVKHLSPERFDSQNIEMETGFCANYSVSVQTITQISRKMLDSSFGMLMLLNYLIEISGQVFLTQEDISRIKFRLIPMVEDMLIQWIIVCFVGSTPTTRPPLDDFSSQLSSLNIDNNDNMSLHRKLGTVQFTLACLLDFPSLDKNQDSLSSSFLNPSQIINLAKKFISSILWRKGGQTNSSFFSCLIDFLAPVLLRHTQFEAAESLLSIVDTYTKNKKGNQKNIDDASWCSQLHLRGFCLLMLANNELDLNLKEQKIHESIRCFFRAASCQRGPESLQKFSTETGFQYPGQTKSMAVWRVLYYEYAMHLFDKYNMSEAACRFAIAALEQVDGTSDTDLSEPASTIRGRLWGSVFKCSLELKRYGDAYSAIASNPDQDSKFGCLKRFVLVLCETGATEVLCDGQIPFIGLVDSVEKQLFFKADRSDISAKPNLYKVLYAFEAQRNNWRKAASFMYLYATRLRKELNHLDMVHHAPRISSLLQEILNALSSAINALQLVDRVYAWIDLSVSQDNSLSELHGSKYCVDLEALEKEYIVTSAQRLLCLRNNNFKISGNQNWSNLVDVLIHENLYDAAFTVILKFWKGSAMKRELERAFVFIAQECCANRKASSRGSLKSSSLLLLSSGDDNKTDEEMEEGSPIAQQFKGNGQWDVLEHYLEKYKKLHGRLPATVAETLLYTDHYIELPLWLVRMFKDGGNAKRWGMTGQESDAATLFRLYMNYGHHAKATNLLLEYLDSYASLGAAEVIERKKMSAVWFPYTAIHQLWCDLEDMQNAGHEEDQCDKLKSLLSGALSSHLKQIQMDSEDVLSSAMPDQEM